jgi:hypothetical protein
MPKEDVKMTTYKEMTYNIQGGIAQGIKNIPD